MRISREHPLLLASASPRRRELLDLARIPFEVVRAGADETSAPNEAPLAYVARVARAKLGAATVSLEPQWRERGAVILTADTTVVLDGQIFGKPKNDDDARTMLRALSGKTHEVITAFALGDPQSARFLSEQHVKTLVEMSCSATMTSTRTWRRASRATKPGAYAIQGMASAFVKRIEGSHTNVIGLPTAEVVLALRQLELLGGDGTKQ